ncbi:MAG: YIP1 family protein [Chloroflexi bacterium]|nr:YIP1 family protein [Chloroflexota bacterium]
MAEQSQTYTWSETWKQVVSDPSRELFQQIMNDPQASFNRAMTWIYLGGVGIAIIVFVLPIMVIASLVDTPDSSLTIPLLCIGPVVGGLLISLLFLGNVATIHWLSRISGGDGSFATTAYVLASIVTPFSLINVLLLLIPILGWIMISVVRWDFWTQKL